MAKEPNLLNNLFRRLRERSLRGSTIKSAAEKIGLPTSTLTKIENGEMENPNEESFDKLLRFYGKPRQWGQTLAAIWKLANDGNLPSDESMVTLPADSWLVPEMTNVLSGPAGDRPTRRFSYRIYGPATRFSPMMAFEVSNANYQDIRENWVAAESIIAYLIDNPRNGKLLTDFFHYSDWMVFEASNHPLISQCPSQVIYVDGILVAFQTYDNRWAVTANERVLREWAQIIDSSKTANYTGALAVLNPLIRKTMRVRELPITHSSSNPFAGTRSTAPSSTRVD